LGYLGKVSFQPSDQFVQFHYMVILKMKTLEYYIRNIIFPLTEKYIQLLATVIPHGDEV